MKKIALLCLYLILSSVSISQEIYQPKNLKQAVKFLDNASSQSLKDSVIKTDDNLLENLFYPSSKVTIDDKYVFEWTTNPSKLKNYLSKKGLKYFHEQVLLSSFKYYLINGKLDEDKILLPYIEKSKRYAYEDENRKTIDTLRGVYIPKDLDDCFKQLDVLIIDFDKNIIKVVKEEELISNYHFGLGMWLRNNWQLWGGSRLSYYFNDMGITEPDDMSSIILTSYQRNLKGEKIKLEEQIKFYQDYWREQKESADQQNELEFNHFNIGDTISYRYHSGYVSNEQEEKYFNRDCVAKGIVLSINRNEKLLQVKIIDCCDRKGIIVSNEEFEYNEKLDKMVKMEKPIIKKAKKDKIEWFKYDLWYKE
ncbi:MAG: hypothetical protein H6Q16_52 [Bacteroidetes bacterium]|nr:hypothetical protein [Bacteroidota bacterium]